MVQHSRDFTKLTDKSCFHKNILGLGIEILIMIVFSIKSAFALAFALLFYKILHMFYNTLQVLDINFNLLTLHQKMKLKLCWV